jgi:hypothetical protein
LSEGTRSNGLEPWGDDVSNENCDSSYPDVCIASPRPDLDCVMTFPIRIPKLKQMTNMDSKEVLMVLDVRVKYSNSIIQIQPAMLSGIWGIAKGEDEIETGLWQKSLCFWQQH